MPPKLQEKYRLWRCVHFVPAINQRLFEPLIMRSYQVEAGLAKKQKRLEEFAKLTEEDVEKSLQSYENEILQNTKTRQQEKKEAEERRIREAAKG
jgi:hypothetical protein